MKTRARTTPSTAVCTSSDCSLPRRNFLKLSAVAAGTLGSFGAVPPAAGAARPSPAGAAAAEGRRGFNTPYRGAQLSRIAFPLGGVRGGKPFCDVRSGTIDLKQINYTPRV